MRSEGNHSQDVTLAVTAMAAGQAVRELQSAQVSVRVGERVLADREVQVDVAPRVPPSLLLVLDGVNTSHEGSGESRGRSASVSA